MRKTILIFIVFICLTINAIAAEEKTTIFHGYQKVKWGSSLATVKKHYTNLRSSYCEIKNVVIYVQHKPNNIIEKRTFAFYKQELCFVTIEFRDDLKSDQRTAISAKLKSKYGAVHKTTDISKRENLLGIETVVKGLYADWFFNNATMFIRIEFLDRYTIDGVHFSTSVLLAYCSLECEKKRQQEELKEKLDKIDDF